MAEVSNNVLDMVKLSSNLLFNFQKKKKNENENVPEGLFLKRPFSI